jgi:HTH-type transcriptional regulator/antitoxin HigA
MATKVRNDRVPAPSDRYLELIHAFPLRPIRSEAELEQATTVVEALAVKPDRDPDEEAYLDVLTDLIRRYEDVRHAIERTTSGAGLLAALLEESGITPYRLAAETGIGVSTLSEILNGKSGISPRVRKKLATHFRLKESAFL